jgi:proteasome component ECM29
VLVLIDTGVALHPYYYRLVNPEVSIPTLANAESKMGIDRPTAEDKFGFPRFSQLILYFFSNNNSLPASFGSGINLVAGKLPPKSFAASLSFVKRIAIWEALGSEQQAEIKIDEDWDRNVDSIVETDEASRSLVEAFLAKQLEINPLVMTTLLDVAWEGMVYAGEGVGDVRNIWNDLAILVPQSVMSRYVPQLAVMQRLLASAKTESWRTAAFAVGLLGSYPMMGRSALAELMQALVVGLDAQQNSAFLSFGYISSRLKLRSTFECVDVELLKQGIGIIANTIVESKEMAVVEDAIVAFGELAVFNVVGKNPIDAEKIQKALVEKARRGDEKAAQCLGYLALLHPEDSKQCEDILKEVIKVGEEGGMEIAFVAGEALVNASAGWGSSAVRRGRMISGLEWSVGKRKGVKKLLDMLLDRANEPGGGGKRRITVVGLLSVFELCTEDEGVKERLSDAQEAFRGFLADRDGMFFYSFYQLHQLR